MKESKLLNKLLQILIKLFINQNIVGELFLCQGKPFE